MKREYKSDYFCTRICYKLAKPIVISKQLGISLINYYPKCKGYSNIAIYDELGIDNTSVKDYEIIKKEYEKNKESVEYISKELFNKKIILKDLYTYDSYCKYIMSTILVVKYNKQYEEKITYEHKKLIIPSEKNENNVINYINFINFLIPSNTIYDQTKYKSDDFLEMLESFPFLFIQSFTINNDSRKNYDFKPFRFISKTFANVAKKYNDKNNNLVNLVESRRLNSFKIHLSLVIDIANKVENILHNDLFIESFRYMSNSIYIAENSHDDRTSILLYSSVLESLLTHKPDYNRFNVEESISKQFALKICIILEKECDNFDMERYSNCCKLFYDVRSDIVHGNVEGQDKIIKQFDKLYSKTSDYLNTKTTYDLVLETIRYELRNILYNVIHYYLKDKKYVEFIKNN